MLISTVPLAGISHLSSFGTACFIIRPFSFNIIISLVIVLALLIGTSMISTAEAAFFYLSPADLEKIKDSKSRTDIKILDLVDHPKRLLATLLISLNFVNIAIVMLSSYITVELFDFSQYPVWGFIFQVVIITFMILVIGEVIPKIYATQHALTASRFMAYPMVFLSKLFYPVSSFLMFSTSIIDKRIKRKGHNISVDELSHALALTPETELPMKDRKILRGIVKFGDTDVKQIMKSRMDVSAFEYNTTYTKLLSNILESGFSRIPIYKENFDNVAGILYVKDLLPHQDKKDGFNWQTLIRAPFFVPENKKIDDLLMEFQQRKVHMAVVVDEYGGTSGIVTLEDVIEEIVGEINDEFDDDDIIYSKLDEENYVFEGKILLKDLCRILELDDKFFEEAKGESDTLAGFLIELEKRILKKNETTTFKNLGFKIESADNRRIKRVKVTLNKAEEETEQEPEKE